MRVKTFQGKTLEEIIPKVREELGDNAVILSQQQSIRGGVGGFFGTRVTEVVAADRMPSDEELVELEAGLSSDDGNATTQKSPAEVARELAAGRTAARRSPGGLDLTDGGDIALPAAVRAEISQAEAARANSSAATTAAVTAMNPIAPVEDPGAELAPLELEPLEVESRSATVTGVIQPSSVRDAAIGTDPVREKAAEALAAATRELERQSAEAGRPLVAQPVEGTQRLDVGQDGTLREVETVYAEARRAMNIPQPLTGEAAVVREQLRMVEAELDDRGVERDVAQALMWHVVTHLQAFEDDTDDVRALAREALPVFMNARPGWRHTGRQHRMALVGPTGVGKTTIAAKLAETYEQKAGLQVGVIMLQPQVENAPTQSASAASPFASLPHLDVRTVATVEQLDAVLERFVEADLVLIDTPGSAFHDEATLEAVGTMLAYAQVSDVQVVVPMSTSPREARSLVARFDLLSVHRIIVSKMDESAYVGQLLNFCFRLNLPISYLASGPAVPQGIRAASALQMAELIVPHTTEERG